MDRPSLDHRPTRYERRPNERAALVEPRLDRTVMGADAPEIPFHQSDGHVFGGAEPDRTLGDRVEDRLYVRGGLRDDSKDPGKGGLPLEGLLRLVEQPHV